MGTIKTITFKGVEINVRDNGGQVKIGIKGMYDRTSNMFMPKDLSENPELILAEIGMWVGAETMRTDGGAFAAWVAKNQK